MRELLASLTLLSACGFSGAAGNDVPPLDGGADADTPLPPTCEAGFVDLCGQPPPTEALTTSAITIDTDNDARCRTVKQTGGPDLCLLYFTAVEVEAGGTFFAHGVRPLALASATTMSILGTLDVSSKRSRLARPGAGSSPAATGLCTTTTPPIGVVGLNGGGGGAGGTLATQGGSGGLGDTDGLSQLGGTPGAALPSLTMLRGGCDGQTGGAGRDAPGGLLGLGGGAVYLTAASLNISGAVLAGGSGGGPAGLDDGGGGGGSGGVIVVQSASLAVSGTLIATGGGGGQGGDGGDLGEAGDDATSIAAARGGNDPGSAGIGGNGATSGIGASGVQSIGGAGGGGGGAGFILLLGASIAADDTKIMPPATKVMPPATAKREP
jgi:hypothetical protein